MIAIPNSLARLGSKASTFLIKHGPKIMTIGGAGMALAGTVMACEATFLGFEFLQQPALGVDVFEAGLLPGLRLSGEANECQGYGDCQVFHSCKDNRFLCILTTFS